MDKKIVLILIIICVFLLVSGVVFVSNIYNEDELNEKNNTQNYVDVLYHRAVMVNNEIYIDTYKMSDITKRCGMLDGEIKYQVEGNSMPTKNDESNFCINIGYQKVDENNIDLRFDDGWRRFTKL